MCPDGGSVPSVELSTVRKEEGGCGGIIRDIDGGGGGGGGVGGDGGGDGGCGGGFGGGGGG